MVRTQAPIRQLKQIVAGFVSLVCEFRTPSSGLGGLHVDKVMRLIESAQLCSVEVPTREQGSL